MPVRTRKKFASEGGKRYKIVEVGTGKVEGQSDTKRGAEASARARNAADREKRGR